MFGFCMFFESGVDVANGAIVTVIVEMHVIVALGDFSRQEACMTDALIASHLFQNRRRFTLLGDALVWQAEVNILKSVW